MLTSQSDVCFDFSENCLALDMMKKNDRADKTPCNEFNKQDKMAITISKSEIF